MIKRVQIANLRGIRAGTLENLSRLVVMVGPNGSGKSTVLEACFVGGTRYPATALGEITERRSHTWNGARWVLHGGTPADSALIDVEWRDGTRVLRRIHWDSLLVAPVAVEQLAKAGAPRPYSAFRVSRELPKMPGDKQSVTGIAASNQYWVENAESDLTLPGVRLVEPRLGQSLHDLFSLAVQRGHKDRLIAGARSVVPDLIGMEILTEEGQPRLFLTYGTGAVPATLAGDGMAAMLRTAFELSGAPGGTVLLEEPEVHQHPRSLGWCAKSIVACVRDGVQVVLTTHSLDLLDRLLAELRDDEVGDPGFLTVLRIQLSGGALNVVTIPGQEAESARTNLEEDLR